MANSIPENTKRLRGLARDVAALLGDWIYDKKRSEQYDTEFAYLVSATGMKISLDGRDSQRIEIQGYFESETHHRVTCKTTSITVSASRPAAAIAKEIERRLLPAHRAEFTRVMAIVHSYQAATDAERATHQRLLELTGRALDDDTQDSRTKAHGADFGLTIGRDYVGYGRIKVYADDVSLELTSIPLDVAQLILDILNAELPRRA